MATAYTFNARRHGTERVAELSLLWEVRGDPIGDNFTSVDDDAATLYRHWRTTYPIDAAAEAVWGPGAIAISWYVHSTDAAAIFEVAPFQTHSVLAPAEDFLSHFTWPEDEEGQLLRWGRLPVTSKRWRDGFDDKGGFIQEATGWKPSALQPFVYSDTLDLLGGYA